MFPLLESITKRHHHKFISNFIYMGIAPQEEAPLNESEKAYPTQNSEAIHRAHSASVSNHIKHYTSESHYDINKALLKIHKIHEDFKNGGDTEYFDERRKHHKEENRDSYHAIDQITKQIDSEANIKYPFYVFTAVKFDVFQDFLKHGNGTNLKYHHPAFTSTSTNFDETQSFVKYFNYSLSMVEDSPFDKFDCTGDVEELRAAEQRTKEGTTGDGVRIAHIIRIQIPTHGKAVSVRLSSEHYDEEEILIQRNLDIIIHDNPEIISKRGYSGTFYFIWDAEYVGHTMMDI